MIKDCYFDVLTSHQCDSKKKTIIDCLNEHGMYSSPLTIVWNVFTLVGIEHKVHLTYCDCESLIRTMCQARVWPATPNYPHYAFSFALMEWAKVLLLECQVSLKDFCNALSFRAPFYKKVSIIMSP